MSVCVKSFSILVDDYDRAIPYYTHIIGLKLLEDTVLTPEKRWVRVGCENGLEIILAKASNETQSAVIGHQTGGRVGFFLHSDDFTVDFERMNKAGVDFIEAPRAEKYGRVVVFRDLYGNLWDLIGA